MDRWSMAQRWSIVGALAAGVVYCGHVCYHAPKGKVAQKAPPPVAQALTSTPPHTINITQRYGLEYREEFWTGQVPHWTVEPDLSIIEDLARTHLHLDPNATCTISFFAQGVFNKLFKIECGSTQCLMRVTLPVDPYYKMASEITTLKFVHESTNIPVPKIMTYNISTDTTRNPLGFEWMLTELMPGQQLTRSWRKMNLSKKKDVVRKLAHYQSQLFEATFDRVGNLYQQETSSQEFEVGHMVAHSLFLGDRFSRGAHGPFRNSYEWLHARLSFVLEDNSTILREVEDEDEREDAENAKGLAEKFLLLLPAIFPPDEHETSILFHDDLIMQNILVDNTGALTAVVDWECVSTLPLWKACQPPGMLDDGSSSHVWSHEPKREDYGMSECDAKLARQQEEEEGVDCEGMNIIYWEHMLEYDIGILRPFFLEEMQRLQPRWVEQYKKGEVKRDFEKAVGLIDASMFKGPVQKWLDAYLEGKPINFKEAMCR